MATTLSEKESRRVAAAKARAAARKASFQAHERAKLKGIVETGKDERAGTERMPRLPAPGPDDVVEFLSAMPLPVEDGLPDGPLEGRLAQPREPENYAIQRQARAAVDYGPVEIFGVMTDKGAAYYRGTLAALHTRFPDTYTRIRRQQAGVKAKGCAEPSLIERYGVAR